MIIKKALVSLAFILPLATYGQSNLQTEQVTYEPAWDSLLTHQTPEWFEDAKFGISIHSGVYSVPTLDEQVETLVGVVAKNGFFLLNVSPNTDGTICDAQPNLLLNIGQCLEVNARLLMVLDLGKKRQYYFYAAASV